LTWREQQRAASFRGVAFHVRSAPMDGGKRTEQHEFLYNNAPFTQEFGDKARSFKLSGFVIGPDYIRQRDRLEAAFVEPGPGLLVHPDRGEMLVTVTDFTTGWNLDEGGMASLEFTCVQFGAIPKPTAQVDTPLASLAASEAGLTATSNVFANRYTLAGMPNFVVDDAQAKMGEFGSQATQLANTQALPTVMDFVTRLPLLLANAQQLASQVQAVVKALGGRGLNSATPANLRALQTFGNTWLDVPVPTPQRAQQNANMVAIRQLIQQTVLLEQVAATATTAWPTYEDAVATRNDLRDRLAAELLTAPDTLLTPLRNANAAMVQDISQRAVNLKRLRKLTLVAELPALVLAYRLYGTLEQEQDLINRNRVRHPGFVPAGRPLDVLSA
jgi:prophage DNA circulation protein